jgi:hypothetical protein
MREPLAVDCQGPDADVRAESSRKNGLAYWPRRSWNALKKRSQADQRKSHPHFENGSEVKLGDRPALCTAVTLFAAIRRKDDRCWSDSAVT